MGEAGRPDADPVHAVYLSGYWIARHPVTNAEYAYFVRATGHPPPPSWSGEDYPPLRGHYPVTGVSWFDAMACCLWLRNVTGQPVRLPTEAEWERAARLLWPPRRPTAASPVRRRPAPNGQPGRRREPLPAGRGTALPGNVWEWCLDGYDPTAYRQRGALTVDPLVWEGAMRVVRGGSFRYDAAWATPTARLGRPATLRLPDGGFRLVISPCHTRHLAPLYRLLRRNGA